MNELPRQKLCQIVAIYGDALYEDDRKTEGLLRDFCGEYKREIHVLVSAVKEKVATDLRSSQHSLPVEVLLPRLTRRLVENRAIAEPAAQWAVESWALALGIISRDDCSEISDKDNEKAAATQPVSPAGVAPTFPGIPVTSLEAQSLISEPAPYTLQPGLAIASFEELPDACEKAWERAVDHFVRGYFTEWLARWLAPLRARGRYDYIGGLEPLVHEVRFTQAEVAQGDDIVRGAALEDFLQAISRISGKYVAPELSLAQDQVDLGLVEHGDTATGRFTFTNATRGFLHGRITSNASGLLMDPSHFGCRCGEEVQVEVAADTAGLKGSPRGIAHSAEISIISNGGRKNVTTRVIVGVPALNVETTALDFGSVMFGASSAQTILITNSGIGELMGWLESTKPWLKVREQELHCSTGETGSVKITAETIGLAVGSHQATLRVSSNGGNANVKARVEVLPSLVVHTTTLDFGEVVLGATSSQTIRITNSGSVVLVGELQLECDWLKVSKTTFRCEPGEIRRAEIIVDTSSLKAGSHQAGLTACSNGGETTVQVRVAVLPALVVQPTTLDFGKTAIGGSSDRTIQITNSGAAQLVGELWADRPWLSTDGIDFHCGPGETTPKKITVDSSGLGLGNHQVTLSVSSNWGSEFVHCKVSVVPPLEVIPRRLCFNLTSVEQSLKIRNLSDGSLCVTLQSGSPWLTIGTDTLELHGNQSAEVSMRAGFGFLGRACDETEVTVTDGNTVERIKVEADGRSIPPPRSRLGWELRCPDGSSRHTQSEAELRKLIAEGYWINNTLPRRPIADLTPDERLHGIVKERKVQGAVVDIGAEVDGLLHISQFRVAPGSSLRNTLQEGDSVVVSVTKKKMGSVFLTMLEPA